MSYVVSGLTDGEKHFAIRCTDNAGHLSTMSNPVSASPGEGILLTGPDGKVVADGVGGKS